MEEEEYDLFVIGGGSGGLAAAKAAAELGAKVGLADYVTPSPQGTKWGLGGTCVNVGCIPKKLMHCTALAGELAKEIHQMGWNGAQSLTHDWNTMVKKVNSHIKKLNWGYKVQLRMCSVDYINMKASFIDSNTLSLNNGSESRTVKAKNIIIACGGRPSLGGIPGADECCITSDDLFWLQQAPGKTLVVGASYIALECAGFLHGTNNQVQVLMRSIPLRGFDLEMANKTKDFMVAKGIKFQSGVPISFEKTGQDGVKVTYKDSQGNNEQETFETVLLAIGSVPDSQGLNLQAAGVELASNGKIQCNAADQTNVPHIYAIGDVQNGRPELTPVAIAAGKKLSQRLFGSCSELMDYNVVPTTVFTPVEYSCCGLSEEKALELIGQENIEVYHSEFKPLEWNFLKSYQDNYSFTKIIVDKRNQQVKGFHYLGPNAGDVMQGFAAALKVGISYQQLANTIGIHPTAAEEIVKLDVTKSSGKTSIKTGC